MPGLSLKDQSERAQQIWDKFYKQKEPVRQIALDLDLTTQAVYAFMNRRKWPLDPNVRDKPARPVA